MKNAEKKIRAFGPKIRGVPKSKKKVVFWHKKCEKFRIRHPIYFFSKNFQPTHAAEKALCTKRHFSHRNHSFMKKNAEIPKISKILLSNFFEKKVEKKIEKKIIFFFSAPAAPRHHFFFPAPAAPLFFFFLTGKPISLGKK